jgi:hypothetical protein
VLPAVVLTVLRPEKTTLTAAGWFEPYQRAADLEDRVFFTEGTFGLRDVHPAPRKRTIPLSNATCNYPCFPPAPYFRTLIARNRHRSWTPAGR